LDQSELSDLSADLRAYLSGRRESKREQELLRRLRALPQRERMELLAPLLEDNTGNPFVFVDRAQLSRADYLTVFKQGLVRGNPSSVKFWLQATIWHLGWRTILSALREAFPTNPRGVAFALYHLPFIFREKGPSVELRLQFLRLVVLCHEKDYQVVGPSDFNRITGVLWDSEYASHDAAGAVSVEFRLSLEDWLNSRHIDAAVGKTLQRYQADYMRFNAEDRSFSANAFGWRYTNSNGIVRYRWSELTGVAYLRRVMILMTASAHYPLPRSAFLAAQIVNLTCWLDLAMGQPQGTSLEHYRSAGLEAR
jgi:hypothetical protein